MNTMCGSMGMGMGGMGMMNPMMMGAMNPMMGMMGRHGMHHMMNPMMGGMMGGMGMNPMMGGMMGMHGHHGMHGMHHMMNPMMSGMGMGMGGMGMMNPMMGGMGMMGGGGYGHHHHHKKMRSMFGSTSSSGSGSSSSDSADGVQPHIVVNDLSKSTKKKRKKRRIRRLQELQPNESMQSDVMPLTAVTVEKCVWTQREVVCIRFGAESEEEEEEGHSVSIEVEYATMDLVDSVEDRKSDLVESGYRGQRNGEIYDTNEWTIDDMVANNAQIYECHDHFDLFEEVCIEKWQLQEEEVTVLLKGGESGDLEYVLTEKEGWNEVVVMANEGGRGKEMVRECRQILVHCTLCIEMTVDAVTRNIDRILKVAISSPAVNGMP